MVIRAERPYRCVCAYPDEGVPCPCPDPAVKEAPPPLGNHKMPEVGEQRMALALGSCHLVEQLARRRMQVTATEVGDKADRQYHGSVAEEPVLEVMGPFGLVVAREHAGKKVPVRGCGPTVKWRHVKSRGAPAHALDTVCLAQAGGALKAKEHASGMPVRLESVGRLVGAQVVAHEHEQLCVDAFEFRKGGYLLILSHHGEGHVKVYALGDGIDHTGVVDGGLVLHAMVDHKTLVADGPAPASPCDYGHVVSRVADRMCQITSYDADADDEDPHETRPSCGGAYAHCMHA